VRTFIIGDIHGCAFEFEQIISKLSYERNSDHLYLTGDAFTKGPDPAEVWNLIQDTGAKMVLGNHDVRLLDTLRLHLSGSLDLTKNPLYQRLIPQLEPVADLMIPWLETLPLWINNPSFILVHAGINPEKGLAGTSREEFLTIRTWPPVDDIKAPRWYEEYHPNNKLVIFGHDAPIGLIIKRRDDGAPYLIGLDTGCVYGGCLSAYIYEEDTVEQIKSQQIPRTFLKT
tara:strand:- start:76095 stop:76778 length:684 start_codon:yes stop_codon:yes gene_type:complete